VRIHERAERAMCIRAQLGRETLDERDGATLWGSHFPVLSRTPPEFGEESTLPGKSETTRSR
jgi:hypothetical protein